MVTRCLDIWSSSWLRGLRETFVRVKCRCRTEGRRSTRVSCLAWSGSGTWAWRDSGNKEGRVTEAESQRHAPLLYIWCSISFVNFSKAVKFMEKMWNIDNKKRYDFQDFFCQCNFLILFHPETASLNKKTEIYQSCKHRKFKFLADCKVTWSPWRPTQPNYNHIFIFTFPLLIRQTLMFHNQSWCCVSNCWRVDDETNLYNYSRIHIMRHLLLSLW